MRRQRRLMDMDGLKRQAAARALEEVRDGMKLGLGTGSTARHFVDLLGERVRSGLRIIGVPTSEATRMQAEQCGIALSTLDELPRLDLTVDGADEVDGNLDLIKGAGGALLREKIVAAASDSMIVIADVSKLVPSLGRFPLPIEVNRFGLGATRRAVGEVIAAHKAEGELRLRETASGEAFVTDGGHWIIDAHCRRIPDAAALARDLNMVAGVVENGLFVGMARMVVLAGANGIRVVHRA